VHKIIGLGQRTEIGGAVLEDRYLQVAVAGEEHSRVVRDIEPFVGVDREAVGQLHPGCQVAVGRRTGGEAAKGRIHMQPERKALAQRCNRRQVVKVHGVDRPGVGHHDGGRPVQGGQCRRQRRHIHCFAVAGQQRQQRHLGAPHAEQR
jgi:hypothetical protein